jgi:hypothetical protein
LRISFGGFGAQWNLLVGGVGLRRGRRDPHTLSAGDDRNPYPGSGTMPSGRKPCAAPPSKTHYQRGEIEPARPAGEGPVHRDTQQQVAKRSGPPCWRNTTKIRPFRTFRRNVPEFLCRSDCMAEGRGFELSIRD